MGEDMGIRRKGTILAFAVGAGACQLPLPQPPTAATTPSDGLPRVAFSHVTLIDGTGGPVRTDVSVVVAGGKIDRVGPTSQLRLLPGTRVIDSRGKYLIPGLSDNHVHFSISGHCIVPALVMHGITSVRDVGSDLGDTQALRARIAAGEVVGPRIRTSGPIFEGAAWMTAAYGIMPREHEIWRAAPRVVAGREGFGAVVDSLVRAGVDLIKARNVWGDDFLAAAVERAGVPFASHNPNRLNMVTAARAGLDSFEHSESIAGDFDTMTVVARTQMYQAVARAGAMVTPTLITEAGTAYGSEPAILAAIADTAGTLDPRNGELTARLRRNWLGAVESQRKYPAAPPGTFQKITAETRAMHHAGITLLAGSDVGGVPMVYPGSSLHDELELLVREVGLTPHQALLTATRNPPRFFRVQHEIGTVEAGKAADLVLLDADPLQDIRNTRRIRAVVLAGRYLDRAALDALGAIRTCVDPPPGTLVKP
jgi:imidazolonepropionase-like amidohydrolase